MLLSHKRTDVHLTLSAWSLRIQVSSSSIKCSIHFLLPTLDVIVMCPSNTIYIDANLPTKLRRLDKMPYWTMLDRYPRKDVFTNSRKVLLPPVYATKASSVKTTDESRSRSSQRNATQRNQSKTPFFATNKVDIPSSNSTFMKHRRAKEGLFTHE